MWNFNSQLYLKKAGKKLTGNFFHEMMHVKTLIEKWSAIHISGIIIMKIE